MKSACDSIPADRPRHGAAAFAALLALTVAITASVTGCSKPLFPDNAYRTQYDHYDRLRGEFVEARQTDPYGRPVPALRQRLRPR
jgi:hypothetical protein